VQPIVVVAEEIAAAGIAVLEVGATVVDAVGEPREALLGSLGDADALVVRSATRVDAELLAAAPRLRVVGRAGTGVDNIDLEAATTAGVLVVNAPTSNSVSAAEHTMALLLGQARRIPEADRSMRGGAWERSRLQGVEVHGKVLGLIGLGRSGTLVAQRAAAFGMRVIAYDPYVGQDRARRIGVEPAASLGEVLSQADFITVHLPRTRDTEGLIGPEAIAAMKPGVRIVNASRGGIVDEDALVDGLRSGRVAGAALDVFAREPLERSPLVGFPQVVLTPHLGASTAEAQDKAGIDVATAVAAALRGELVASAVNVDFAGEVHEEVAPFLPVAEHLGATFVALAGRLPGHLVLRVEGQLAAHPGRPLVLAALKGALAAVSDAPVSFVNAPRLAEARGIAVTEETTAEVADYVSVLRVRGTVAGDPISVSGTVVGRKGPVLVEALDHEIELPFSAHMLLLFNDDVPGMIGRVGSALGGLGVNIANMVVGRSFVTGERAMMGLNLDRRLTDEEVEGLRALPGVGRAWYLDRA
jgi:D-3-phosphoglycerate dehydrogenase